MKKRLLLVVATLVFVLMAIMPTQALAAPGKSQRPAQPPRPTQFTAEASVHISDPGTATSHILKNIVLQSTKAEVVSGSVVSSSGWPDFEGAGFTFTDISNTSVLDLKNLKMTGVATGTVSLVGPDGSSTMKGTYFATLRGKFVIQDGAPAFREVTDSAHWVLNAGTGGFSGLTASGEASLTLTPQEGTLAGPMEITGQYQTSRGGHGGDD